MRLSPVAIRHWPDRKKMSEVAALQTRTTHGAPEAVDASILFADMLADAIAGKPMQEGLAPRPGPFAGNVERIAKGSWKGTHRDQIRGTGYVIDALEAALWCVSRTTSYRTAVLLAANLGEDADTTAAITGQLAGALYGLSGIPLNWLTKLAWRDRIEETGRRLRANEHGQAFLR